MSKFKKNAFFTLLLLVVIVWVIYIWIKLRNNNNLPPVFYELNFENKNIMSNVSNSALIDTDLDPIVVWLTITWIDINNIKWITWSIKDFNSDRLLSRKYLNWIKSVKYFDSLWKTPGEYLFEAEIEYYDWSTIKSSDYFSWPILTIWPNNRPDIPMVSIKIDKENVYIGEVVNFEATAKILSKEKEFETNRIFKRDFDWDWIWDLTTWANNVQHIYTKANREWYIPMVSVVYKNYKWIGRASSIVVKHISSNEFNKETTDDEEITDNKDNSSEYQIAKRTIVSLLPSNLSIEIKPLFTSFEAISNDDSQQDKKKELLQEIIDIIYDNAAQEENKVQEDEIDPTDITTIVIPNLCKIIAIYKIPADSCTNINLLKIN